MKLYKWLANIFLFIVPSGIAIVLLVRDQEPKVAWGFGGILLSMMIFLSTFKRVKEWVKLKTQAHETAANTGQVSQTTPFLSLEIVKFTYYAAPLGLLIWIDSVFASYNGSVGKVLGFVVLSYLASGVFNYLSLKTQQVDIQVKQTDKQMDDLATMKAYLSE